MSADVMHPDGHRTVRPATLADAAAVARVHVDAWRETYTGMLPAPLVDLLEYREREEHWTRSLAEAGRRTFVAETGGAIVGFARGGANREPEFEREYPGELQAIYLLDGHKRSGLGRTLFDEVRTWLQTEGLAPFLVWVFTANPSRAFYERLGGTLVVSRPSVIRGETIVASAYGFR